MAAPKSKVKKKIISIRLRETERQEIERSAKSENLSVNQFVVREALRGARSNGQSANN